MFSGLRGIEAVTTDDGDETVTESASTAPETAPEVVDAGDSDDATETVAEAEPAAAEEDTRGES